MKVCKATLITGFTSENKYATERKITNGENRYSDVEVVYESRGFENSEQIALISGVGYRAYVSENKDKTKAFVHYLPETVHKFRGEEAYHLYFEDGTFTSKNGNVYYITRHIIVPKAQFGTAPKTVADVERISELEEKAKAWDEYQAALIARRVRAARKKEAKEAAKKNK